MRNCGWPCGLIWWGVLSKLKITALINLSTHLSFFIPHHTTHQFHSHPPSLPPSPPPLSLSNLLSEFSYFSFSFLFFSSISIVSELRFVFTSQPFILYLRRGVLIIYYKFANLQEHYFNGCFWLCSGID